MANAGAPVDSPLSTVLHRLAAVEPRPTPVVSLYLDLAPDRHGRDVFLRKATANRLKALEADPEAQAGLAAVFRADRGRPRRGSTAPARAAAIFAAVGDEDALHRHRSTPDSTATSCSSGRYRTCSRWYS